MEPSSLLHIDKGDSDAAGPGRRQGIGEFSHRAGVLDQISRQLVFQPSSHTGNPRIVVTDVVRKASGLARAGSIHPFQPAKFAGFRQNVAYSPYPRLPLKAVAAVRK
jgi:hypothetical protein